VNGLRLDAQLDVTHRRLAAARNSLTPGRDPLLSGLRVIEECAMADTEACDAWVSRVLNITVPRRGETGNLSTQPLTPIWNDAKDAVDRAIEALRGPIGEVDDPLAQALLDRGLPSISGRLTVPLMAALMSYDQRPGPATARAILPKIEDMRAALASVPVVTLLETNPFGVSVSVRKHLLDALDRIAGAIAA
jgi:hypothetical protein